MKKYLLFILLLLTDVSYAGIQSYVLIPFEVCISDPSAPPKPRPKSPINVPTVVLDDHQLIFQSAHPAYTLYLYEEEVLVYSTEISPDSTIVNLPSWLSGEYEIQLYMGECSYYFCGFIEI